MVLVDTIEIQKKDRSLPDEALKDMLDGMVVGSWAQGRSIPRGDDCRSHGMALGVGVEASYLQKRNGNLRSYRH